MILPAKDENGNGAGKSPSVKSTNSADEPAKAESGTAHQDPEQEPGDTKKIMHSTCKKCVFRKNLLIRNAFLLPILFGLYLGSTINSGKIRCRN